MKESVKKDRTVIPVTESKPLPLKEEKEVKNDKEN